MQDAIRVNGIGNVYIVTARSEPEPVTQFLNSMGIKSPRVVATNGSEGKAIWLTRMLNSRSYDQVMVYEDCRKNITMLRDIVKEYNETTGKSVVYKAICILPSGTQEIIETIERLDEGLLDWFQGGLDIVGFVPGAGEIADAINALISIVRGNMIDAFLSAISMIPVAGDIIGKSGKVVMKVFAPTIDVIKAGAPAADIIKKIGLEKLKKIEPAINAFKESIVKYKEEISKIINIIIDGDVAALEKITGLKVPKIAAKKFESVLAAAGQKLKDTEIEGVIGFFADFNLSGFEEEYEEDLEESYAPSLHRALFGEKYINSELRALSESIKKARQKRV